MRSYGFLALFYCVSMWIGGHSIAQTHRSPKKLFRFALLIGHNNGGASVQRLRYAETDAKKMRQTLVRLGGYPSSHIALLLSPKVKDVLWQMLHIQRQILFLRQRHGRSAQIVLFVYYSGHAKQGRLLLGKQTLSFRRIKSFMRTSQASLRLAIFDACESGKMLGVRGLKRLRSGFRFPAVHLTPSASGEVVITATGANGKAHEDPLLQGGIFTHYFLLGLKGAADRNNDGHVTLEEAYTYSYSRSLERSIFSQHGPQRARFSKRLSGYGSLVLTTLSQQRSWLLLGKNVQGSFFLWNKQRDLLLAELSKTKGHITRLVLAPGLYTLQWRLPTGVYSRSLSIRKGHPFVIRASGPVQPYWKRSTLRGSVLLGSRDTVYPSKQRIVVDLHTKPIFNQSHSFTLAYYLSYNGLKHGILQQGGGLHIQWSLNYSNTFFWMLQSGYQFGQGSGGSLRYNLHHIELSTGPLWKPFSTQLFHLGLGVLLRTTGLIQDVLDRDTPESTVLSFSGGLLALVQGHIYFHPRFFCQLQVLGGVRFLQLGQHPSLRWELNSHLGLGIHF